MNNTQKKHSKRGYFHYQKEILNTISEPASFISNKYKYVFVNSAFNNFFGVKTSDIVGKTADNLWGKECFETEIKPLLDRCLEGEEVFIQYEGEIPNNGVRILEMNFYPHWKSSKRIDGIISTSTDITLQKEAENNLKQNESRLKNLNATKDKLFSIIGHDLKGPLNNILGFSELIEQGYDSFSDEDIRKYNKLILESSQSLAKLLDNLLTWSRSQRNIIEVSKEVFPIFAVAQNSIKLLENNAIKKDITIKNNVPQNLISYADSEMISTVIRNLVSNAIKFTKPDGEITISAQHKEKEVVIEIRDNGIGIPTNKIEHLFEPDQTIVGVGTDGEKGTGLGLIICKDFVEKNNGKIWAESEPGKGSVFYVSLPSKKE